MSDSPDSRSPAEFDRHDASFVVRIWWERSAGGRTCRIWRGYVQHVQSRQEVYFTDLAELGVFMQLHAGPLSPVAVGDRIAESAKEEAA